MLICVNKIELEIKRNAHFEKCECLRDKINERKSAARVTCVI